MNKKIVLLLAAAFSFQVAQAREITVYNCAGSNVLFKVMPAVGETVRSHSISSLGTKIEMETGEKIMAALIGIKITRLPSVTITGEMQALYVTRGGISTVNAGCA